MSLDIAFVEEAIPEAPPRTGGGARPAIAWESLLAPLKSPEKSGKSFRAWDYEKKSAATSRRATVTNRLIAVVPSENWTVAVRAIPKTDPERWGVYVQFNGTFTDEQVAAMAKARADRSAKIKASREATKAAAASLATNGEQRPAGAARTPDAAKVAAAAKR
jgi:hypothetical protein